MGTKDRSKPVGFRFTYKDGFGGSPDGTKSKVWTYTRTRTGVSVDDWRGKILRGENATSTFTGTAINLVNSTPLIASARYRINPFGAYFDQQCAGHVIGKYTNPNPAWTPFTSRALAQASSKFLKEVREAESAFSGLIFLGELRETLRMLRRPAEGLQELLKSYLDRLSSRKGRKGRRLRTDELTKAASQLWLEYAFGWKPLLHDIEDARKAYDALFRKERIIHVSGGGKDFIRRAGNNYTDDVLEPAASGWQIVWNDYIDQTEIVRFRGVVRALAVTTAQDRVKLFGFTPGDFLPTAWELLPWSFLIDYFANIGDMLEAVVTDTSKVIWVSKVTIQQMDIVRSGKVRHPGEIVGFGNVLSYGSSVGNVVIRKRTVSRTPTAGFIMPELVFRLPHTDSKLLNIAALLEQIRQSLHHQTPISRNWHR